MKKEELEKKIMSLLNELRHHGCFNLEEDFVLGGMFVAVVNVDGDWKHSHRYCDSLMKDAGFEKIREEEIGDSESDCYEANHTYRFDMTKAS